MKVELYLVVNHYIQNDIGVEGCAVMTKLSKKHMIKSSVIIDLLSQAVLKNDSGVEDEEKLLDHYFSKYKEPIATALVALTAKAERYPHVARQIVKYANI